MNYSELKEILKHLKKTVNCNNCKKKFATDDMQVVSTYNSEGLFHFTCHNCENQILVHVAIMNQHHEHVTEKSSAARIETQNTIVINQNDILDMHNFLNNFNGSFKELFQL